MMKPDGDLLGDGEDIVDFYLRCTDNLQTLPSGLKEYGNLYDLYQIADLFASQYGMGGCRTLEEYVNMINTSDPVIINMLKFSMAERLKQQNSVEPVKPKIYDSPTLDQEIVQQEFKFIPAPSPSVDLKANRHNLANFLGEWGANRKELKETLKELDQRKMTLNDYSWLDRHTLSAMPPEKFKETLKMMSEDRVKSKNFKVSLNTMISKPRE
jgi:hypothetical protein